MKVGFIGLGKMGFHIATNINKKYQTYVYNRTDSVSVNHALLHGTIYTKNLKQMIQNANIILMCLPTYKEVDTTINTMLKYHNGDRKFFIDCTSSEANFQKNMYEKLNDIDIIYFDAPVSGGPEKAYSGTLTSMIGGDKNFYPDIENVMKSFSIPIYVGKIGNGCAIKAINNIMNVSHLCIAAEGLHALENIGIDKEVALNVINKSSGRSLMTQERFPVHILEKNYNYGFSLGLMNKDVNIALNIIDNPIMFSKVKSLLENSIKKYGYNADYTNVTKQYFKNEEE